ncbi:MAG: GTP 3',8-cyclase MoaA [Sedimentisphaerales bacterium]|nr:GTP 3',8-cyclase MoaA [Sedimentisphaerales bacterium]
MSIDCLRLSVTDKCNLRCVYCHPQPDCRPTEHEDILGFEEMLRIVRLFAECGIKKLRLTGGEPLIRCDIVRLVRKLGAIAGIKDLSITTNGVFLESLATELKDAGLQRINISVDSIERKTYERITGFDLLPKVIEGIHRAIDIGLKPVKINCVIIKDLNDSEEQITALSGMSTSLPVSIRFIEYYPTNNSTRPATDYVPNAAVRAVIERKYGSLTRTVMSIGNGPAEYFKVPGSAGTIGFISGRSSNFCLSCSRLRLTSDGKVMPCLYSARSHDLKRLISSQGEKAIRDFLSEIIAEKANYTKLNSLKEEFSMCKIGG